MSGRGFRVPSTVVRMADNEGRTVFDENDAAWVAWQLSPWGAMRYRVVAETLHRAVAALGGGPLRVLDVGGGDGADSVPLAAHGHDVTVVDPSASLLARARGRAESAAVRDHVATVAGGIDDLQALDLGTFDLVLCHNVLQYQPDLERSVASLVPSVSSTGLLSVMCPNPASDVLTAALRLENPVRALAVLDAETVRRSPSRSRCDVCSPPTWHALLPFTGSTS